MSTIESSVTEVIEHAVREFPESTMERRYEQDPLVAVLVTSSEAPLDHLRGGQALQRLLLTATAEGLSASFLPRPTEIPAIRDALRELIGGRSYPQTVLRVGFGYPAPQTPHRLANAVTSAKESS